MKQLRWQRKSCKFHENCVINNFISFLSGFRRFGVRKLFILRLSARETFSTCVNAREGGSEIQNSFYGSKIYHSYAVSPNFYSDARYEREKSEEKKIKNKYLMSYTMPKKRQSNRCGMNARTHNRKLFISVKEEAAIVCDHRLAGRVAEDFRESTPNFYSFSFCSQSAEV